MFMITSIYSARQKQLYSNRLCNVCPCVHHCSLSRRGGGVVGLIGLWRAGKEFIKYSLFDVNHEYVCKIDPVLVDIIPANNIGLLSCECRHGNTCGHLPTMGPSEERTPCVELSRFVPILCGIRARLPASVSFVSVELLCLGQSVLVTHMCHCRYSLDSCRDPRSLEHIANEFVQWRLNYFTHTQQSCFEQGKGAYTLVRLSNPYTEHLFPQFCSDSSNA